MPGTDDGSSRVLTPAFALYLLAHTCASILNIVDAAPQLQHVAANTTTAATTTIYDHCYYYIATRKDGWNTLWWSMCGGCVRTQVIAASHCKYPDPPKRSYTKPEDDHHRPY